MTQPLQALAERISSAFSSVYYHCHPTFEVELSHQAVRALQFIQMMGPVTIQQIADHLGCASNTASEIVRRLAQKGLIEKMRSHVDERIVQVSLTAKGQQTVMQHTGLDVQRLAEALSGLSSAQCQQVEQGIMTLLRALRGVRE
ncbi:MarR family winged helix-turn-helix transcriptional regulator [Alicyclobacillus suci]|uniref:MarR family winged helix-turn-helix transcriptional regulator n=1 Tax=Alicyclobacillus suci TaxID=2816080 RepID=UPI001A8E26ED|nr:MarR family winged helix-turn-helix transcriptional regulator [Alicyclobacillus suci]